MISSTRSERSEGEPEAKKSVNSWRVNWQFLATEDHNPVAHANLQDFRLNDLFEDECE